MTTLAVRHSVSDYDAWKAVFDEHGSIRRTHGATGHRVLLDGNDVLVLVEFPDAAAAQSFQSDASLRAALQRASIEGTPDVSVRTEAEQVQY
ncbi:MAG: cyclase [Actinomycetes bacterium]